MLLLSLCWVDSVGSLSACVLSFAWFDCLCYSDVLMQESTVLAQTDKLLPVVVRNIHVRIYEYLYESLLVRFRLAVVSKPSSPNTFSTASKYNLIWISETNFNVGQNVILDTVLSTHSQHWRTWIGDKQPLRTFPNWSFSCMKCLI